MLETYTIVEDAYGVCSLDKISQVSVPVHSGCFKIGHLQSDSQVDPTATFLVGFDALFRLHDDKGSFEQILLGAQVDDAVFLTSRAFI